jgi:hypothetical protein
MVTNITDAIVTIHELSLLSLEFEQREQYAESFNVLREALNKAQSILSLISVQEKYSKIIEDNVLPITVEVSTENKLESTIPTESTLVPAVEPATIESKLELETSSGASSQKIEAPTSTRLRE